MGLVPEQVIASQQATLIKQFTTDFVPSPIDQQVQWKGHDKCIMIIIHCRFLVASFYVVDIKLLEIYRCVFHCECVFMCDYVFQVFSGLCHIAGQVVLPPVVAFINSRLNNPKLVQVTDEDYAIYLTPEGTLYNQKVVEQ